MERIAGIEGGTLECAIWDAAGRALWFVDIPGAKLHRLDPASGDLKIWTMPQHIGCFALREKGGAVVALRNGLYEFDFATGACAPIWKGDWDPATTRFNDGRCDARGRFYAGTMFEPRTRAGGALYRLDPDLTVTKVVDATTVSNGLAFAPDGARAYFADSPTHTVTIYDVGADGSFANGRRFAEYGPGMGRPDGGAVDAEGHYWSAAVDGGKVLRWRPDGTIEREIPVPTPWPTMVCLGGDDLKTLFVTSLKSNRTAEQLAQWPQSGGLFRTRVDVPGRVEPKFAG